MRLIEQISQHILQIMRDTKDGEIRLSRKELAEEIGCVPSQINYVLSSRFTPEQGYLVESKRGGGGYIIVRQIVWNNNSGKIMHVINSIGECLDEYSAKITLANLSHHNALPSDVVKVMYAAVSNQAFLGVPAEMRDFVRANIMKQMLVSCIQISGRD